MRLAWRTGDEKRFLAQALWVRLVRELILHLILRPLIKFFGSYRIQGREHLEQVPRPILFAANHASHMDTPLILLGLPWKIRRRTLVVAASDYFFSSWPRTLFFSLTAGAIPIERQGSSQEGIEVIKSLLAKGWNIVLYPEGTRSVDGRLYRGRSGGIRAALEAGATIVPIGVTGTFASLPKGRWLPRRAPVMARIGTPVNLDRMRGRALDRFALRSSTRSVMQAIRMLTGQEYVDQYSPGRPLRREGEKAAG